jgi:hypothetical protein
VEVEGTVMSDKEKLVELLMQLEDNLCDDCGREPVGCAVVAIADHLIAHGVTVQGWISVKDRLPEIISTHKRYRSIIKKSIRVLCVCVQKSGKRMVKEGYCEWYNDYPEPRWQIPGTIDEVTHWQYLPQPPKGE